jgi:hypothetical protein
MSYFAESLSNLVNIFASPREAYRRIAARPITWFALLLLVAAWIAVWNWYYHAVDFSWLVNHLIDVQTANAPSDQRAAITQSITNIKPGALIVISSATVVVLLLALSVIMSLYLLVVSAVVNDTYRLKQWFSFAVWSSTPSLIGILAMIANFYLTGTRQVAPEQLNPLSLNNLFFHVGPASPYKRILDSIDLTLFWSWVLMIVGYHTWTGRSIVRSALVILAPLVVIYGVWLAMIVF